MAPGPIIPPEASPLKTLTVAMTVMCYLACLAIGALILIDRAVENWTGGLSREVTVQVRKVKNTDIEAETRQGGAPCSQSTPGVAGVDDPRPRRRERACSNPGSAPLAISTNCRYRA